MDDFDDTLSHDNASGGLKQGRDKSSFFFMLGMGAFLLSCLILFVAVFMYFNMKKAPAAIAPTDTAAIMLQVGRLVDLPSDETPQVAPINDVAPFLNQPFFARARVGDVLIIYMQKHVAILYSSAENKIVNMSKISVVIPKSTALP